MSYYLFAEKGKFMSMLLGNSLWHLVATSDVMAKIILIGLLIISIVCWTIVFYKMVLLRAKRQQMQEVLHALRKSETLAQVVEVARVHAKTYPGYLLVTQLEHAKYLLQHMQQKKQFSDQEIMLLDERRYECIEDMIHNEGVYLSTLGVTAQVSPLIGLFGTVWGLTHAFISISQKQSADIVTVAPGIAEALLTTIAGLMVAVPALVAYHYLKNSVNDLEHELYSVSERVNFVVRVHLLQGKNGDEISLATQEAS